MTHKHGRESFLRFHSNASLSLLPPAQQRFSRYSIVPQVYCRVGLLPSCWSGIAWLPSKTFFFFFWFAFSLGLFYRQLRLSFVHVQYRCLIHTEFFIHFYFNTELISNAALSSHGQLAVCEDGNMGVSCEPRTVFYA